MTTVISRYFEDTANARDAKRELVYRRGVSLRILSLITSSEDVSTTLGNTGIPDATQTRYAELLSSNGGAVLLVRAGYKPLGVAKTTRTVAAAFGASEQSGVIEEVYVKDELPSSRSVLLDHPHFLSRPIDAESNTFHMANWPIPLINRRKPFTGSLFPRHARMADRPIGLLLSGDTRYGRFPFDFLVPGHKHMAKFPFAHLIPGNKHMAGFPIGHLVPGHRFMAKFPFAHLVPGHKFMAKFPFGHLVPGHARMANWPFPLLINGKRGTNSLVPGQRYMAKFPFAHLVPGHKYMAKFPFSHIVPGHKFMAKFPISHLIPGHKHMAKFPFAHIVPGHKHMAKFPFDHLVPGHKYMANWILPHTK